MRRRELIRYFPPAMGATVVGLLCGIYLMVCAEVRCMSGELLDNLALPILVFALGWMFYHRIGSKRNRS